MATSTIDALPDEILTLIYDLLVRRFSVTRITNKLHELGEEDISRSAVGRWAKIKRSQIERQAQMQDMATGFAKGLNPDDEGKDTTMLTAIVRRAIFTLLNAIDPADDDQFKAKAIELQQLSKSLESLAKADHTSMSRIYTIRKEERLEMAAKFEKSAIKRGISAETIQGIRAEILGLDDDA
jgi:Protein of unknown function (DUF3486)